MSRLEELIESLCPDGVEYKAIGEVCSISVGGDVPRERFSKEKTSIYSVPIVSNGVGDKALQGYTDKPVITQAAVTVSARGTIGYVALRTEAFYPVVRLLCLIPHEDLLAGFLKYAVEIINFIVPKGGIQQLTIPMISKYIIPVPPIEVQAEIVRILDKFTELISLLERELELRHKQYMYYCEKLMTFGDDVELVRLDSFAKVIRGKRLTRSQLTDSGKYAVFHAGIEPLGYYDEYNREADTVMIINAGYAGTVTYSDKRFWSSDGCFCIEKTDKVLDRFLYHYLKNNESYFKSRVRVAAIPTLDRAIIEQFMIPVPPLEEQERIASMLDRFASLCDTLPTEITARRKQYAYYRDKLLTFTQKTSPA